MRQSPFLHTFSSVLIIAVVAASGAAACADQSSGGGTVTVDRTSPVDEGELPTISLSPAFPNLTFNRPVQVTHAGDGSDRLFVIEQHGRVVVFENNSSVSQFDVFLDIRDRVFMGHNEEGLLSIAFHPQYADNGRLYVWYSAGDRRDRRTVLSRFTVSDDDRNQANPDSEQVLLEVDQPWGNHNGATVKFGPDGYLYVSIGDGGAANDPRNYSQNMQSLLGKIIRIDVNARDEDLPYAIPSDNPFVDDEDAKDEIWAIGLRNVWRMSFDRDNGDLWAADVGQDAWEAVYVITRGGNYGWSRTEGSQPFDSSIELAGDGPMIDPVIEYSHRQGKSITGGYVSRSPSHDKLQGAYIYADYVTGRIWAVRYEDGKVTANREILPGTRRPHVTSFGEDEAGELYLCAFERLDGRGSSDGRIMRIVEN